MTFWKLSLLGLLMLVGSYTVWLYVFGSVKASERRAYWQETVAQEIPLGATKQQIQQWTQRHAFTLDELPQQHKLYISLEKIPDHGLICSEWSIIMQIKMDQFRSLQQNVESYGSCF